MHEYLKQQPNFFRKRFVCFIFFQNIYTYIYIYIYIRNTSLENFEKVFDFLDFFYDIYPG